MFYRPLTSLWLLFWVSSWKECEAQNGLGAKRLAALPFHKTPSPEFCSNYPPFRVARTASYPPFSMLIYGEKDVVSQTVAFHRFFELPNSFFMTNVLNILKKGILVDFGANLGWFSLLAASKGHSTISIEAIPCNHWALSESIKLNGFEGSITLHNKALSSTTSSSTICVENPVANANNLGNSKLQLNELSDRSAQCPPSFLVPLTPLHSLIPSKTHIGFMKADCEGCELGVLLGSESLFFSPSAPCAMLVEWYLPLTDHFEGKDSTNKMLSVLAMLHKAGYVFVDFILGTHSLRVIDSHSDWFQKNYNGREQKDLKVILTTERCFPKNSDRWNQLFSAI
jgi:FkbM family methyltransferase